MFLNYGNKYKIDLEILLKSYSDIRIFYVFTNSGVYEFLRSYYPN